LALVLISALAVRLAVAAASAHNPWVGDELSYHLVAWNLATGHGYGRYLGHHDAERGPSYIFLVAGIYRVFGQGKMAPFIFQAFLDTLNCFLVFRICLLLFKRYDVAVTACLLYAGYPRLVIQVGVLINEVLMNTAVLLGIYLFLASCLRAKRHGLVLSAAALGIGALTKPILALFPFLFAWSVRVRGKTWSGLPGLAGQLAIIALVMSP